MRCSRCTDECISALPPDTPRNFPLDGRPWISIRCPSAALNFDWTSGHWLNKSASTPYMMNIIWVCANLQEITSMLIDKDKGITLGSTYTFLNLSRLSRTSEHPGETKPRIDSAVATFMPKTGLHLHPGETKPRIDSAIATFMPKNGAPPSLEHGSRHEYAMRYRIVSKHL